jgi:hypothetical protein
MATGRSIVVNGDLGSGKSTVSTCSRSGWVSAGSASATCTGKWPGSAA